MKYNPLYLDGPLKGQKYETDHHFVYAMEYPEPTIYDLIPGSSLFIKSKEVMYQMRQLAITVTGDREAFVVWVAWCGPYNEPPLQAVIEQLYSKDALERGEHIEMPRRETRYQKDRAPCPSCGHEFSLNQDGTIRHHSTGSGLSCRGSGSRP